MVMHAPRPGCWDGAHSVRLVDRSTSPPALGGERSRVGHDDGACGSRSFALHGGCGVVSAWRVSSVEAGVRVPSRAERIRCQTSRTAWVAGPHTLSSRQDGTLPLAMHACGAAPNGMCRAGHVYWTDGKNKFMDGPAASVCGLLVRRPGRPDVGMRCARAVAQKSRDGVVSGFDVHRGGKAEARSDVIGVPASIAASDAATRR